LIGKVAEKTGLREAEVRHKLGVFSLAQMEDMLGAFDKNKRNREYYSSPWHEEIHVSGNTDDEMIALLKEVHAFSPESGPDFDKEAAIDLLFQAEMAYESWSPGKRPNADIGDMAREKLNERISEEFDRLFISLPLFLYDHSGITMSTGRFSCPWDSGQVGFIYVSREKIRETYGWKVITKKREERIYEILRGEVEVYDQYLTGDVYGYLVYEVFPGLWEYLAEEGEEIPADWQEMAEDIDLSNGDFCEEVDSCWGYYGDESAREEAESIVKYREEHHGEVLIKRQQEAARRAGQLELSL
jgi:hypothetical protein